MGMGSSYGNSRGWPKGSPTWLMLLPTGERNGLFFEYTIETNYVYETETTPPKSWEPFGTIGETASHYSVTDPPHTDSSTTNVVTWCWSSEQETITQNAYAGCENIYASNSKDMCYNYGSPTF